MLHLQENVDWVTARIQTLSVVLGDTTGLQSNDLPDPIVVGLTTLSPESNANAQLAFVADCKRALVLRCAILQVEGASLADIKDNPDDIDRAVLDQLLNPRQPRE